MIGYVLPGVQPDPSVLETDVRLRRLAKAGPWQMQPHNDGALVTWKANGPRSLSEFGPKRQTADGMIYFPPKVIPQPADLLRPGVAQKQNITRVAVEVGGVDITLLIEPAYATPRQILENDILGEFSTVYAQKAMALWSRCSDNPNISVGEVRTDLNEVCRLALMNTYRTTPELLADCGWLTTESTINMWGAITQVPKALTEPGAG